MQLQRRYAAQVDLCGVKVGRMGQGKGRTGLNRPTGRRRCLSEVVGGEFVGMGFAGAIASFC